MKVPCRWLADYVEIDVTAEAVDQLAYRLTLAGLEVELLELDLADGSEPVDQELQELVAGVGPLRVGHEELQQGRIRLRRCRRLSRSGREDRQQSHQQQHTDHTRTDQYAPERARRSSEK